MTAAVGPAELEAARLLLARMGISPADLVGAGRPASPTFAEYIPVVREAVSDGSRKAYNTYWNRVLEHWSQRRIDEVRATDIERLAEHVKANRVQRRNARGGHGSAENLIAALRCLYRRAVADGLLSERENPALKVSKPRRMPTTRRAVPDTRLAEINEAAARTSEDPDLDSLLLRLHTETACRRGGALALRPMDLDPTQCLIRLQEKGDTVRWQPVSPTLMRHLLLHAEQRQAPPDGQLLRYRNGRPITRRRYDTLWGRIGEQLPWVATQQISTHWLRHTTLTWVERNFGYAIARGYAGHTDRGSDVGSTATYVKATIEELAAAVSALTGEPHPMV